VRGVRGWIAVGWVAVALAAGAQAMKPVVTVGSDAQYKTVQAAVDAAPEQGEVIRITPGIY
jgi:pectin methylesterase-like acyl-CoA thioesterase